MAVRHDLYPPWHCADQRKKKILLTISVQELELLLVNSGTAVYMAHAGGFQTKKGRSLWLQEVFTENQTIKVMRRFWKKVLAMTVEKRGETPETPPPPRECYRSWCLNYFPFHKRNQVFSKHWRLHFRSPSNFYFCFFFIISGWFSSRVASLSILEEFKYLWNVGFVLKFCKETKSKHLNPIHTHINSPDHGLEFSPSLSCLSNGDYLYSQHLLSGKVRASASTSISTVHKHINTTRASHTHTHTPLPLLINRNPKFLQWKCLCSPSTATQWVRLSGVDWKARPTKGLRSFQA